MLVLLSSLAIAGQIASPADVDPGARPAPPAPPAAPQIIHGEPADADVHPSAGGIVFGGRVEVPPMFGGSSQTLELRQLICSSTLIAPDVVLAAAHCVDPYVLSQGGEVLEGEFRWSRKANLAHPDSPAEPWPADAVAVRDTRVPDGWDIAAMNDFDIGKRKFDISLLFLDEPVTDVDPSVLVDEGEAPLLVEGAEVEIVGWGMQEPMTVIDSFSPPEPGTFAEKRVGVTTLGQVGKYEVQVGGGASPRKCKGDSGGPTFLRVDEDTVDTWRLVGVTSRSADFTLCAEKGGFDTRVDAYLGWIDEQMRAACADGTRAWCDEPGVLAAEPLPEERRGACSSAPGIAGWGAALLAAAAARRRR